ncbi:flavin reductase, partial [Nocardia puris]
MTKQLTAEQRDFRAAMSNLSAAVNVVTTNGPGGRAGITVSAVCSVTDSPPTVLVCVNQSSYTHAIFRRNERLCVNVLSARDEELAGHFA